MLSKEKIENMKEDLINLQHMLGKKPSISTNAIKNALQYIEQLEIEKQDLIEALEEDAESYYTLNEDEEYVRNRDVEEYAQEILKIVKGENE